MLSNNSHKTAITRNRPSVPMQILNRLCLLYGDLLDYGSGKGFDADYFKMDKFDPYYHNVKLNKKYDTITCNYVLNTIESENEIQSTLRKIHDLLNPSGIAYITVRRDIKKTGVTSKGTFQRNIKLDLPALVENTKLCIYILKK